MCLMSVAYTLKATQQAMDRALGRVSLRKTKMRRSVDEPGTPNQLSELARGNG